MAISSLLLSFIFLSMINSNFILHSSALQLVVGGRDGWVLNPKESYDQWARRLRFQVNDTLIFRYSNTTDSVLTVSKTDYDNCNVNNPVIQLYGGSSVFVFGHSGPFYFITGNKTNCQTGQKLLIVVLAIRSPPASPTTPPPPPASSPILPPSAAPTPSGSGSVAPGSSPASSPTLSPSAAAPTPSTSVAPGSSPASSPEAQSPASTSTPAGSPSTLTPVDSPPVSPALPVGPGGAGNVPADINSPTTPRNGSSATATFTPAVSTLAVSYFFIMALGWSIIFQ